MNPNLTPPEPSADEKVESEVKAAAEHTWSQIASDWMEGFDQDESSLNDSHVAEAVFAADSIRTFNPELSAEALDFIAAMEWPNDMHALCKGMA
jgi:hypothetical protein